jgi:hypothetical protein
MFRLSERLAWGFETVARVREWNQEVEQEYSYLMPYDMS